MKSILIIGLGDFGHHLCRQLVRMNNDVFVIDKNEEALEDLSDIVSGRIIADCTSISALQQVGVSDFDMCFVCIGSDFKSNLIIVSFLKELGARYVISETDDELLERLLLNNGANEIIHPNKDSAVLAAVKYSSEHILDYRPLKDGYSIYEITPLPEWVGKTIIKAQIKDKYDSYIIAVVQNNGQAQFMPGPQTLIRAKDTLMILTNEDTMQKLLKKMEK